MLLRRKMAVWFILACFSIMVFSVPVQAESIDVSAKSYILMDADSGQVLLAKDENARMAPASMTKLMTLILAMEDLEEGKVGLKDRVIASENAWKMGGSQIYLEPGEEMTYEDMLIAIAVGSANDACVAVAEHLEGTHQNFVDRMNKKAEELGLKNTHFVNSHGLSDVGHYTSAYDMAVIARHALQYPKILEYTAIKEYDLRQGEFKLFNTNKLLWWYQGADGFKTGFTNDALWCLTSTAKRDGLRLISVVMASSQQHGNFRDSMTLFNYGFAKYSYKTFYNQGTVCGEVRVGKGIEDKVEVVAADNAGCIVLKGEEKNLSSRIELTSYIDAPVQEGQKLGEILVFDNDELVKKVDLVSARSVPRAGFIREITKMIAETYLL
ncbi:MAG: D-alanyl-D-alanine carboxypeptidase family protein [Syntrophomonadaceae bacterium]|jgi:D-alanyl-D-alanine carboxypeptidase (penicillin-binding protein 5/6)